MTFSGTDNAMFKPEACGCRDPGTVLPWAPFLGGRFLTMSPRTHVLRAGSSLRLSGRLLPETQFPFSLLFDRYCRRQTLHSLPAKRILG